MEITSIPEVFPFICGDCSSEIFTLKLIKNDDEKTVHLLITCGNESCLEKKRLRLGLPTNELLVWESIDVTGRIDEENFLGTPTNIN